MVRSMYGLFCLGGIFLCGASASVYTEEMMEQNHRFSDLDVGIRDHAGAGMIAMRRLRQEDASLGAALLHAAQQGNAFAVQRLLNAGADANFVSPDGRLTPLIMAATNDNVDAIRVLLQEGALVGFRTQVGTTALEFAAINNSVGAVKALLAAGANPNEFDDEGYSPVHRVSTEGHVEVLQELVNAGGDISTRSLGNSSGGTPLHFASQGSHLSLVELLLKLGAEVDAESTKFGSTPLYGAAIANAGSLILVLIQSGANVNHSNNLGITPLGIAAYNGNQEAIEVLVENGAHKAQADSTGFTPLDVLCQCQFSTTVTSSCRVEDCEYPQRMIDLLTI